jgi:hypothetical protein
MSEPTIKPTTKACLESAALGAAQLIRMVREWEEGGGKVDDIVNHDEAVALDTNIWDLMDSAEEQRDGS